tara:strand:- start:14 stop:739 length:726 start_codon:yes stop_codon:yes gene_type:complete
MFKLMKKILLFFIVIIITSCNHVYEAVYGLQNEKIETITYNDYRYVINKKKRRGYVSSDNEVMDGHFLVMRNGTKAEEFQLKNGFLHGFRILFDEDGMMEQKETYKNSYLNGPNITYYKNGTIKSESSYKNGKLNSDKIDYDESGNILNKTTIVDGISYKYFYKQGKLTSTEFNKDIENEKYDIIVKYDHFENISTILGRKLNDDQPILFVFDSNYNITEVINATENPQRARHYLSKLNNL